MRNTTLADSVVQTLSDPTVSSPAALSQALGITVVRSQPPTIIVETVSAPSPTRISTLNDNTTSALSQQSGTSDGNTGLVIGLISVSVVAALLLCVVVLERRMSFFSTMSKG